MQKHVRDHVNEGYVVFDHDAMQPNVGSRRENVHDVCHVRLANTVGTALGQTCKPESQESRPCHLREMIGSRRMAQDMADGRKIRTGLDQGRQRLGQWVQVT